LDERQISGYIMAAGGFVMILMNALSYLLGWDLKSPAFTILGLVLIVTGTKTARKSPRKSYWYISYLKQRKKK
jgi:hypothetical protein